MGCQLCKLQGWLQIFEVFYARFASMVSNVAFVHSERKIKSKFMRTSQRSKISFKRNARRSLTLSPFVQFPRTWSFFGTFVQLNPLPLTHSHPAYFLQPISHRSNVLQKQVEKFYLQTLEKVAQTCNHSDLQPQLPCWGYLM